MVQYCIAFGCTNSSKTPGIGFHRFPKDTKRFRAWEIALKRDTNKNVKISTHMRVCSAHFKDNDYKVIKKQRRLKEEAIPSVFVFTKNLPQPRRKIAYKKNNEQMFNQDMIATETAPPGTDASTTNDNHNSSIGTVDVSLNLEHQNTVLKQQLYDRDLELAKCRQEINKLNEALETSTRHDKIKEAELRIEKLHSTNLDKKIKIISEELQDQKNKLEKLCNKFSMTNVKQKDETLTYYTGFDDINIFQGFYEFVVPNNKHPIIDNERKAKIRASVISVEDELLLVLAKFRQNFDNIELSVRFGISRALVGRILSTWTDYLYNYLGNINIWPHRDIIFANTPPDFAKDFPKTIIILDGTEIRSQIPSSLVRQSQYYSNYKSSATVKVLLGCDPKGSIIFISQLFTGNISDKEICHKSHLFEILREKIASGHIEKGDTVMVDKGFNIKNELESLGLIINIPAMAQSDQQFAAEDVEETRKIASKRIIVEMVIRKVKSYKILKGTASIMYMSQFNQIFTICCMLSNFRVTLRSK